MKHMRRLAYPLRLAAVRLAHRRATALLVAVGVAAGAAMLAAVLGGSLVARERSLGLAIEEIPAAERAVRAAWFGLPEQGGEAYPELEARAVRTLRRVAETETASLVLFRESTIAGRFLGLGAVDGLARWIDVRSGRLPRRCTPARCEVVRLRGAGRIPNVEGLRLVEVGRAAFRSPLLFGDFLAPAESGRSRAALSPLYQDAVAYHRPPPAPLVLAEGVAPLAASPVLETTYRSYAWVLPLEPGTVHAWEVDRFAADTARARSTLQAASSSFELTAPVDELREAGEAGRVAGRRLLLVGGEAAALLFAFAVLAAASMRRDTEAARRRLTWFGARRWQLAALVGAETVATAFAGAAAGWALGALAAALVAHRANAPAGEVLSHSTLSGGGLLVAVGVALALALVLMVALRLRPLSIGGFSVSPLDATALGALGAVAVLFARGDLGGAALARERGTAAALVLLPGLVTFVAAVAAARLFRPVLLGLERLARGRPVALRLAALSLARHPGRAAVAVAFLVVSVGLALFAESYRSTLARGQAEAAAHAVPLDFVLRQDLSRLVPVREAAPPERLRALGADVRVEPVLRLSGNVSRVGGATGLTVLGLDADALTRLRGWRDDLAPLPPQIVAARLTPRGERELTGALLPGDARRLLVRARGRSISLVASVQTPAADFAQLRLGETDTRRERELGAPVPPEARGGRVVALTLVPPRIQERGADAGQPFRGSLELGPLVAERASGERVRVSGFEDWIGVNGLERAASGERTLRYTLSEQLATRFRPRQPSDEGPVPILASPGVAAAAGEGGRLPLRVAGELVLTRVAAVAEAFPGAEGEFVVADRGLLGSALNTERPGIAVVDEVWLGVPGSLRAAELARRLERPPFDLLAVSSRAELERSLRHDPLARGALVTLLAAALVALALALVGILLGVLSDLRDERGQLLDLETQGVAPAVLRRVVRLRSAVVTLAGLAGGTATAALLSFLVVDLVAVTAEARPTDLPLRPAVDWSVVLLAGGAAALLTATLVAAASRRA